MTQPYITNQRSANVWPTRNAQIMDAKSSGHSMAAMVSSTVCMSTGFSRVPWISPRSNKPTESSDRLTAARAGVDHQARAGDRECGHPPGGVCPVA